ncbi:hypothetical protein CCM_04026 [Cordyceps militaris CM01]|uniref:Uncharacterized protein n=1 Tax=Cordyceps militaris (strain CM01) TaxID=983644 RepID=G3JDH8_CORMM|nr:uncharacterized protein CCM_04026 [Cordyceps militaris CM01]EGX92653.1 hypothetical protein CCM_04026 [Cordyceps militaris CM01]
MGPADKTPRAGKQATLYNVCGKSYQARRVAGSQGDKVQSGSRYSITKTLRVVGAESGTSVLLSYWSA